MKNVNAISEARSAASPRAWRRGGRSVPMAALFLAVVGMTACDGDNLFDGSADDYTPLATVNAPDQIVAGQIVPVRVDAYAARGVAQVAVSFSGVIAFDTVIDVKPAKPSVSSVVAVQIPQALLATSLRIQAQAIDQLGAFSPTAEKMVDAYGPPYVQIVGAPVSVQQGQQISIDVAAVATERVDQIAVKLSGGVDKDTTISISPPNQSVRQLVTLRIPDAVEDTLLTITATARDQIGNRGSSELTVPFVVQPPTVDVISPLSVAAGGMLNLEVRAQALRKVSQLRVELRGGVVKDTVINLNPQQANVTNYVAIKLPGNITDPTIQVRALAMDRSGSLSASAIDLVTVPLDAPLVLGIDAPASVMAGHFLDLRVNASGARPIKELKVHWRGFRADMLDSLNIKPDTTVLISPARTPVTEDVKVKSPCIASDGAFVVNVTARDEANELSAVATAVVVVTGDSACVPPPDTAGDTTSSAGIAISAAPGMSAAGPIVDLSDTRPAVLPGRGYRLTSQGRVRRSRTAR